VRGHSGDAETARLIRALNADFAVLVRVLNADSAHLFRALNSDQARGCGSQNGATRLIVLRRTSPCSVLVVCVGIAGMLKQLLCLEC
jgi:hypothetical protein